MDVYSENQPFMQAKSRAKASLKLNQPNFSNIPTKTVAASQSQDIENEQIVQMTTNALNFIVNYNDKR